MRYFTKCLAITGAFINCLSLPGPAVAQEKVQVSTGYDVTQGFWLVTRDKQLDKKHGIDLSVKTFEAGALALESMVAGETVATGTIGGLPALRGKSKGAEFVAVASAMSAPKISCAVSVKEVQKPKDLDGKTVGLLLGSSTQFWWSRYAAFHGVQNVTLKSLTPPETVSALRGGEIAAFFNWQPWCDRAQGIVSGSHVLAVGGDNNLQPFADAMIIFRSDFIRGRPDAALNLLKAVNDTMSWITANPAEAGQIMAKAYRGDAEQFTRDIKDINWKLKMDAWLRNYLYEEADWMAKSNLIQASDTKGLVDSLLYPDLLKKIDPQAVN